jgi:thiol-disulfide isomerase/thioredoxin
MMKGVAPADCIPPDLAPFPEPFMRHLLPAALVLSVFVLVLAGCSPAAETPGVEVKEVKFDELDKAVADRKGKVVVVDFWATWCAPCVKKFPHFVEFHKKYKDKGLACVSVSMDKEGPKKSYDKEKVLKFLKEQDAAFANFIVADPDADAEKITKRFGLEAGIPFMAVFGKDGKKVWDSEQKKMTDEEVTKLIETELAK